MVRNYAKKIELALMQHVLTNSSKLIEVQRHLENEKSRNIKIHIFEASLYKEKAYLLQKIKCEMRCEIKMSARHFHYLK
jgi:hypothetical protein